MMIHARNLFVITIFIILWPLLCEAEYCSGYTDIDDVYQGGFHCPMVTDSTEKLYCCGTEFEKYCCESSGKSFLNGLDPAAVVGALLAMIIVLLVFISLCCCCCSCCLWNRTKKNKRGGHVRYNNLDGTVNTTLSTSGQGSPPADVRYHRHQPYRHHDQQQPSAPPEILSTASPPFNPHMAQPLTQQVSQPQPVPPIQTMPPAQPMPMPQPYPPPAAYRGGGSEPYPPPMDGKGQGYPFDVHHHHQPPPDMQAPPPYHDSSHHPIGLGFRMDAQQEPLPYKTQF